MNQPWLETPVLGEEEDEAWEAESEDEEAWAETELEDEALLSDDEADLFEDEVDLEYEAEEEWPNPFGTAAGENWAEADELEDWTSPFATEEEWEGKAPSRVSPTGGASCMVDKHAPGPRWQYKPKTPITPGQVNLDRFDHNEVLELRLTDFRVNDFKLMNQHQVALQSLANEIKSKIGNRTYTGQVRVRVLGSTSSTASITHNVKLSEHRAFNVIQTLECLIGSNLTQPVDYAWNAMGEQRAARVTGDAQETPRFRGVMVRVMAPVSCPKSKPPGPVPPRPPTGRTTTLCMSVPRIDPRRTGGIPPDVLPLGTVISGLPLPVAIVTKARAHLKVDNQTGGGSAMYELRGWGLEVAMPSSGRVTVDLRARLQATLDMIARSSATLAGSLNLGPLGLVLRIDAAAFARLVVKLAAELRLQLSVGFAPRPMPEPSGCTRVMATPVSGVYSPGLLTGPATLVVPGRGMGAAQLRLGTSGVRLNPNPVALAADKSTVRTVLMIGGDLRPVGSGVSREEETYWLEEEGALEEWEALELPELETELEAEFEAEFEAELVRGV